MSFYNLRLMIWLPDDNTVLVIIIITRAAGGTRGAEMDKMPGDHVNDKLYFMPSRHNINFLTNSFVNQM